jgi:hypothetical protein
MPGADLDLFTVMAIGPGARSIDAVAGPDYPTSETDERSAMTTVSSRARS